MRSLSEARSTTPSAHVRHHKGAALVLALSGAAMGWLLGSGVASFL